MMARELFSKIVGIWWPTFAFVALGLDHVVANMFFVPQAIFLGSPDITTGYYIWKSMIPSLLGNIVGGGLFVGVVYWYLVQPPSRAQSSLRLANVRQNLSGETKPILVDGAFFAGDGNSSVGQNSDDTTPERRLSSNKDQKSPENMV